MKQKGKAAKLSANYALPPIVFERSFLKRYTSQLSHLATASVSDFEPIILYINIIDTLVAFPQTHSHLIRCPSRFESTLLDSLVSIVFSSKSFEQQCIAKTRIFLVFKTFPYSASIYKKLGAIVSFDLGKWVIFEGTVVRATQRKTLEKSKVFKCSECGQSYRLFTSYHNGYRFEQPPMCTNKVVKEKQDNMITKMFETLAQRRHSKSKQKNKKNKNSKKVQSQSQGEDEGDKSKRLVQCKSKKFEPMDQGRIFQDYQQLVIQEPFKHISPGRIPRTIAALLQGIFIDEFRPGDTVSVSGLLSQRYEKLTKDCRLDSQMIVVVNNIFAIQHSGHKSSNISKLDSQSVSQSQHTAGYGSLSRQLRTENDKIKIQLDNRSKVLGAFCPDIYYKDLIKLATLLSLLGGVAYTTESTKIRGQSHLLLVGEPGTGKSVLLKAAAELSERSFLTNAIGSSSAGLTVSYVKEGSAWAIQAGALVLADNGVCCVDELNLLNKKDYPSVLQAMQQQTISSAKAGVVGKMNCRTTVIAACNPILPGQKYDNSRDVVENTGLSLPLISRFDLTMVLRDDLSPQEDHKKSRQILEGFLHQDQIFYSKSVKSKEQSQFPLKQVFRKCQEYAPTIKQTNYLTNYFIGLRQTSMVGNKVKEFKTVRALESLCRLCQAHAKLMQRDTTTMLDCVAVIMLSQGTYFSTVEEYLKMEAQINDRMS